MKNRDRFERVQALFNKLTEADLFASRIYLSVFYEKFTSNQSIYLDLFDGLRKGIGFKEMLNSNFKGVSEDAIRKSLERFEDKLNEVITLPINVQRKGSQLDSVDRDFLRCLNLIQAFKVRYQLGDVNGSIRVLRQALKLAKKLEMFDFALYCVGQLAAISKYRMVSLKSLNPSRDAADLELQRLNYSKSSWIRMNSFKFYLIDSPNSKQLEELEGFISEINNIRNSPYSASTERNVLYAKLLYYDKKGDYNKCLKVCLKLKSTIESNYAIRKQREIQTIEINLALFYVLDKKFNQSNSIVTNLLDSGGLSDINRSYLHITKIRNLIYLGDLQGAINGLLELRSIEWVSPVYRVQIGAILGYCYTVVGHYKEAIKELGNLGDLKKDKAGWNLYSRILLLLNFKLADNYDSLINEIENFRRYLHGKELTYRIKRHCQIALSGFEKLIPSDPNEADWNPTSSEVGDFDEIFENFL
ncbi:MAG: hypothetical protein J4F31_09735 [Flavobacteriales bacterium]|nr:hypothetical protein [Flavobacteriales bacterium]